MMFHGIFGCPGLEVNGLFSPAYKWGILGL